MTVAAMRAPGRELMRARRDRATFLTVSQRRYLAIDGRELPGSQTFQDAIGTLYPVAYSLHFLLKRRGIAAPVGTIEALYWPAATAASTDSAQPNTAATPEWTWRLLMPVPDAATEEDVERAIREAAESRKLPAMNRLRVVQWEEGASAQMLHVGPYAAEPETIARLQEAIAREGMEIVGPHHEIYLNDPHRVGEAKAKTILRFGVRPFAGTEQKGRS